MTFGDCFGTGQGWVRNRVGDFWGTGQGRREQVGDNGQFGNRVGDCLRTYQGWVLGHVRNRVGDWFRDRFGELGRGLVEDGKGTDFW